MAKGTVTKGGRRRVPNPATLRKSGSTDEAFLKACLDAGVETTARQESKYRNGYGAAARAAGKNHRKDPLK